MHWNRALMNSIRRRDRFGEWKQGQEWRQSGLHLEGFDLALSEGGIVAGHG